MSSDTPELPAEIHAEVTRLSDEGNALADTSDLEQALVRFREAWTLLPEPAVQWDAALWLLAAIGDMEFQLGRLEDARASLMSAMKACDGATGNPFLRLRLGHTMYDLGEETEAASWLAGAFLMEGPSLFEDEDPKYLAFVRPQLRPPAGGWPEGW